MNDDIEKELWDMIETLKIVKECLIKDSKQRSEMMTLIYEIVISLKYFDEQIKELKNATK